jgi:pilus assembly protein Flp/PilA
MYARLMRVLTSERGASMVEYSLLVLLIAIVALVAVALAGTELSDTYSEISSNLVEVGGG